MIMTRTGFTLVELLCCISLLAFASAVAAVGVSGAARRARMIEAEAVVKNADRFCRQAAMADGPLVLSIERGGSQS